MNGRDYCISILDSLTASDIDAPVPHGRPWRERERERALELSCLHKYPSSPALWTHQNSSLFQRSVKLGRSFLFQVLTPMAPVHSLFHDQHRCFLLLFALAALLLSFNGVSAHSVKRRLLASLNASAVSGGWSPAGATWYGSPNGFGSDGKIHSSSRDT